MRRAAPLLVAVLTLALAGCGADDAKDATTTSAQRTVTAPRVPPLTREDAVREVQSAVSQEAFSRDFSYAASDVSVGCAPLDPETGTSSAQARFACRYSTPKGACKGEAQVTRDPDGSNTTRDLTMKCTGPPNIGPDTSQPTG